MVLSGDLVVRIAACVVVMKESKFILIRPVYGIFMIDGSAITHLVCVKKISDKMIKLNHSRCIKFRTDEVWPW
jgi:hypothetical protein